MDAFGDVALIILMVAAAVSLVGGLLEQFLLKVEEHGWIEGVAILVTVLAVALFSVSLFFNYNYALTFLTLIRHLMIITKINNLEN